MKHIPSMLWTLIVCLFHNLTIAQTYHLTVSNEPFVFLENAEPALDEAWDVPEFQLPIGFDFTLFDLTSDTLFSFFNSFGGVYEINLDDDHLYMLIPFYASLIDRGYQQDSALSPIQYKTEGPPGQQIFTLEFREAGLFNGQENEDAIFLDHVSYQVRLHEASGDIEFHYGPYVTKEEPEVIFDPFPGPIVGLLGDADWNQYGGLAAEMMLLEGDPLHPTIVTDTSPVFLQLIPENTVYRFSRTTSVEDYFTTAKQPLVFPNPTSGPVKLNRDIANDIIYPIYISDVNGKRVGLWNHENEISAVSLPPGCYYVTVNKAYEVISQKLIVIPN